MTHLDECAGIVQIERDADTGAPAAIRILDACNRVVYSFSPEVARSLAQELVSAAYECDRHKPLRRPVAVQDALRGLDD